MPKLSLHADGRQVRPQPPALFRTSSWPAHRTGVIMRAMKHAYPIAMAVLLPFLAACSMPDRKENGAVSDPDRSAAARGAQLEQRIARLELLLLEKQAQVDDLQMRLDDARREVVRGMARTQSIATRAEAASGMAEAEIALGSLRASDAAEVREVTELMRLSTAEFEKHNYGGALYLANQAKGAAIAARGQLGSVEQNSLRRGEVAFALPLRLQTTARANLRAGPGNSFQVIFTLPVGSELTGHSVADQWVKVTDGTGRRGWIYQSLIGRRR
jgi:hypothetical protein